MLDPKITFNIPEDLKKFYGFLILLGTIILILSLTGNVKNVNPNNVNNKAILLIIIGVLCWIINGINKTANMYYFNLLGNNQQQYQDKVKYMAVATWLIMGSILLIGALFIGDFLHL